MEGPPAGVSWATYALIRNVNHLEGREKAHTEMSREERRRPAVAKAISQMADLLEATKIALRAQPDLEVARKAYGRNFPIL